MHVDFEQRYLDQLIFNVKNCNTCLFVGAGSSVGGTDKAGNDITVGSTLSSQLLDFADISSTAYRPLSRIYDAVVEKMGRSETNDFLKRKFIGCKATWQKIIPSFVWKSIYTINIDDVMNNAFKRCEKPLQNPIFKNYKDHFASKNDYDDVHVISLHGNVRKDSDGFIFGAKDYATAVRENLSWHIKFSEDFSNSSFIFVGTQLEESDLTYYATYRTQCCSKYNAWYNIDSFLIDPNIDDVVRNSMKANGILCINSTAQDFFDWLDENAGTRQRLSDLIFARLPKIAQYTSSISKTAYIRFRAQFKQIDINEQYPLPDPELHDFFFGDAPVWWDIQQNNDALLTIVGDCRDNLISVSNNEIPVIVGSAGCGKTTALKRIAYDFAVANWQVYFFEDESHIDVDATVKVIKSTKGSNVLMAIDNAADHIDQVDSLIKKLDLSKLNVRFVLAERENRLERILDGATVSQIKPIEMNWLNDKDIQSIIDKLVDKDKLRGLRGKTNNQMMEFFKKYANKQLLVAMKEIAGGGNFDKILTKEFLDISASLARKVYASVALCHSQRISVNQNVILRALAPDLNLPDLVEMIVKGSLRKVVMLDNGRLSTRHILIAQHLLRTPELSDKLNRKLKAELLINLMIALAPMVNRDELIKGSSEALLVKNFMDFDHIENVMGRDEHSINRFFTEIKDFFSWNSKYWAQRGLFESTRKHFADAIDYADYAASLDDHFTIRNTQGTIYLRASFSRWAGDFSKAKALFDKSIEILDSVLREKSYNSPKVFNIILGGIINFIKHWGINDSRDCVDTFDHYLKLARKQKKLDKDNQSILRNRESEIIKLRLNFTTH